MARGRHRSIAGGALQGKEQSTGRLGHDGTVTEADRGRAFAFDVGKGETSWHYRFEPSADGTGVFESFDLVRSPGAVDRFLTRLGTGMPWSAREAALVRGMEEKLANLKAKAELPA